MAFLKRLFRSSSGASQRVFGGKCLTETLRFPLSEDQRSTVGQWEASVVSHTAGNFVSFTSAHCPGVCSSDRFHLICPQNEMSKRARRVCPPLPTGADNTMASRCLRSNASSRSSLFVKSPEKNKKKKKKLDWMLTEYFVYPRVAFFSRSTELQRGSGWSGGAEGRKKREQPRHTESQLNYLEEPDGVYGLPAHVCQGHRLFFDPLDGKGRTYHIIITVVNKKKEKRSLKIIIHDIDRLHKPHRLWTQTISQHFSGRSALFFHLYQMADPMFRQ